MGLPIFITPVEPELASKLTEKAAAVPRSSIRRQRNIRGGSQARSAENRRRRIHDLLDANVRENDPNSERDLPSFAYLQTRAHRLIETEQALSERMPLSEPLSWERRHSPEGGYPNALPPAPEPELESPTSREREIERLHQVRRELRRMGRRRPAPTPPYTETDIAFMAQSARLYRDSPVPSSLTPGRSPVRLSPPGGDADVSTVRYSVPETSSDAADLVGARATRYRELRDEHNRSSRLDRAERAERMQALIRGPRHSNVVSRRQSFREFLHQARMDGLGDRDRSLSPEGGSAWDTLLTSITPDPQPPSAGSSFASSSAAAAAATSSSNSEPRWVSAQSNSMTSLDRTDELRSLRDCDEPSSPGSSDSNTENDDVDAQDLHNALLLNREAERLWRSSYADVARADAGDSSPDSPLEGMHRIISRLAERDDLPESWWASVGLRREPSA